LDDDEPNLSLEIQSYLLRFGVLGCFRHILGVQIPNLSRWDWMSRVTEGKCLEMGDFWTQALVGFGKGYV